MNLNRRSIGYLEGIVSAVLNCILFGLKYWVGIKAGSVSMVADAWHTLSDTLTSLIVIFGFWMASHPSDKKHPFGHGRAEVITAIVIGTMLGLVGITFIRESVLQLKSQESVVFGNAALIVFGISVILKEAIAQFSIRVGKKFDAPSLIADGWHHRSDAIASAVILLGVALGKWLWWIDGVLGLIVSLLIIYTAWEIIKDASDTILGERPSEELIHEIKRLVEETHSSISNIHNIAVHRYGDHKEVTLHVRMPDDFDLKTSHQLATSLEERMKNQLGITATIHVEPKTEK